MRFRLLFTHIFQIVLSVFVVGLVAANPALNRQHDPRTYPLYTYNYAVSDDLTGDVKSQQETREGDVVKGHYSLVEPDGSVRTVNYAADDISGFNAIVSKNGLSIHNLAQPYLVANARNAAPFFQRSPLAKSVFLAPQVTYASLLQQQQQQKQQHTPAATIEIVGPSQQFLPYSSVSYGFNANGQFW